MLPEDKPEIIIFETEDGQEIPCKLEIAKQIPIVEEQLACCEDDDDRFPLLNIKGDDLKLLIEYLGRHLNDPVDPTDDKEKYPEDCIRHPDCPIKERRFSVLVNAQLIREWIEDETNPLAVTDKKWIEQFDVMETYNLMMAANFLGTRGLLNLTTYRYAIQTKGLTPEEIHCRFNIPRDKTDEEMKIDPMVVSWAQ